MRVRFERLLPRGGKEVCETDLLSFIQIEADLGMFLHFHKRLPPLEQLNAVLARGQGDDGFIAMVWQPFTVNAREYSDLEREYRQKRKKCHP